MAILFLLAWAVVICFWLWVYEDEYRFFQDLFAALHKILHIPAKWVMQFLTWLTVRGAKKVEAKIPYTMYDTAPTIAAKWANHDLIGLCHRCGCDDAQIVIGMNKTPDGAFDPTPKCKWCAESDNITYHIKHYGTPRMRKKLLADQGRIDKAVGDLWLM